MTGAETSQLRVLIANERRDRLELLAQVVTGLGHEVIAREIDVREVGTVTAESTRRRARRSRAELRARTRADLRDRPRGDLPRDRPALGERSRLHPRGCKRGVFAYIVDANADELQSAIDITLQRFTEYHSLQGAFGRRAVIEQAKGILMARHALDQDQAFDMLRSHSQHNGRKLVDVAQAVVESHLLLLDPLAQQPGAPHVP